MVPLFFLIFINLQYNFKTHNGRTKVKNEYITITTMRIDTNVQYNFFKFIKILNISIIFQPYICIILYT